MPFLTRLLTLSPLLGLLCLAEDGCNDEDDAMKKGTPKLKWLRQDGYTKFCVDHEGGSRCWWVYDKTEGKANVPLIIDMHGGPMCATQMDTVGSMARLAESTKSFVYVVPQGKGKVWNAGMCCGPDDGGFQGWSNATLPNEGPDDVGFLRKVMFATKKINSNIDLKRVYWTGISNGCGMAQTMAAKENGLVAAMACMAMFLLTPIPATYSPVPIMVVHGIEDPEIPFTGLRANEQIAAMGYPFPYDELDGAEDSIKIWAQANNCSTPASTVTDGVKQSTTFSDCAVGAPVTLLALSDAGHNPYSSTEGFGGETSVHTTKLIYDFLMQHSKTTAPAIEDVTYYAGALSSACLGVVAQIFVVLFWTVSL